MTEIDRAYPESFFRGVTSPDAIDRKYMRVLGEAFRFDGNHMYNREYDEISINWNDDDNSLVNIKSQKKDEKYKYENGIVSVSTKKIKEMKNRYQNDFSYERSPIEGNEYHGNLLLNLSNISKQLRKSISEELAVNVDTIYTYNKEEERWTEYKTEV